MSDPTPAGGAVRVRVERDSYVDSVALLRVSAELESLSGVAAAAAVMATDLNRDVLRSVGLFTPEAEEARPSDLILAVRAVDVSSAEAALLRAHALLTRAADRSKPPEGAELPPRSLRAAAARAPAANLAFVSVPGPYATAEARQALLAGLHVFLFSDNVSIRDERALKEEARARGLLMMGPDCGTSILDGMALGFANRVRRGRVGLVGASGTGLQEVSVLLHQAGEGVSQAIGTGGRDLHEAIGAISTLQALDLLSRDDQTEVIVLVSKQPDPSLLQPVLAACQATSRPVVVCLLGAEVGPQTGILVANNLHQAARLAMEALGAPTRHSSPGIPHERVVRPLLRVGQDTVRGFFCGGTLAEEASLELRGLPHEVVDFGADRFTRGRAHPMIDPSLRNRAIEEAGSDPRTAVILLDLILGFGAHHDPGSVVVPAIQHARERAWSESRDLIVIAHVLGTDEDAQGLATQERTLRAAGVEVYPSNHHAAVAAALAVSQDTR